MLPDCRCVDIIIAGREREVENVCVRVFFFFFFIYLQPPPFQIVILHAWNNHHRH
jgi:hypothetical protein